jgi:putative inorganic carbon (HCO3(-)) transporter
MASTSDPRTLGPSRGDRARFGFETTLLVIAVLLVNLITIGAVTRYGPVMLLAPVLVLALTFAALRLLDDPVDVLCWFLVIIVNLDFLRIQGTRLTADILTSSMLLYAVLVRIGLAGTMAVRGGVQKVFLVYLCLTFISVVLSVNPPASFKNWGRDLEYWVLFIFLSTLAISETQRIRIAVASAVSSVIPCLLGLAGMVFGIDAFYGAETPVEGGPWVKRVTGTLSHPVVFSEYLAFMSTITLSLIILQKRWRALLVPVFLLQLVILYLTYGRTGWIGMLVAIIALFWLMGKKKVVFTVLPMMGAGLLAMVPTMLARMQNAFDLSKESDNSIIWRLGLWAYALKKFPQKPIFGSGQDTFINYVAYGTQRINLRHRAGTGFAAHHTWIGLLIETGLVGMLMFLVLMVTVGKSLKRRRMESDGRRDPIVIGVSAAFAGLIVSSFAGDPFNIPVISVYFWVLLSLALKPRPATVAA